MKDAPECFYEILSSPIGEIGVVTERRAGKPKGAKGAANKGASSGAGAPGGLRVRRVLLPQAGLSMADRIGQEFPGAGPAAAKGEAARLLEAFLAGREVDFSAADLALEGAAGFIGRTLRACRQIPRGKVVTYGGLAAALGVPGGARAVGNAMASNPIALIIPCHRVVRSGGSLGGFGGGGAAMKRKLLEQEGVAFDSRGRVKPEHLLG